VENWEKGRSGGLNAGASKKKNGGGRQERVWGGKKGFDIGKLGVTGKRECLK